MAEQIATSGFEPAGDNIQAGGDVVGRDKIGGDAVGRDKLTAGDDIVEVSGSGNIVAGDDVKVEQYIARQTNINLPRSARLAVVAGAAALIVIALGVILPVKPVVANGDFGAGEVGHPPLGWEVKGDVRLVSTGESKDSAVSDKACEFETGSELTQRVAIPNQKSLFTIWYRSASSQDRSTLEVYLDEVLMIRASPSERASGDATGVPGWNKSVQPIPEELQGKTVYLKIQYVLRTGGLGGRLYSPAQQSDDTLWIDNIDITTVDRDTLPTAIPTPTATHTLMPTATPTPTLEPTPTESADTCAPASSPVTDDISNFQVVRVTDNEIEFTVDYTYDPAHGDNVWMGGDAHFDGELVSYFGYRPAHLACNSGNATVSITYAYWDPPGSYSTDQIEVTLYIGGEADFFSKSFDHSKTWYLAPSPVPASNTR